MQEQIIESKTPVSNDFKEWSQPQLNGNQKIMTTISQTTSGSKQGGSHPTSKGDSGTSHQLLKLSTQGSQKENKDNLEYEWDDDEDEAQEVKPRKTQKGASEPKVAEQKHNSKQEKVVRDESFEEVWD